MELKIGDTVITRGYSRDYDGRELTITRIHGADHGTFYYFKVNDGKYYDPSHNFRSNKVVTVIAYAPESYSIY